MVTTKRDFHFHPDFPCNIGPFIEGYVMTFFSKTTFFWWLSIPQTTQMIFTANVPCFSTKVFWGNHPGLFGGGTVV